MPFIPPLPRAILPRSMKANLHLHSRWSDGSLWPAQIAQRAAATGLELACLTDHDCLGGSQEFLEAALGLGLKAFPACEIDCEDSGQEYRSELLAYFPQGRYEASRVFLEAIATGRRERLFAWLEASRRHFHREDLSFDDLVSRKYGERAFSARTGGASLSKVDFWSYLQVRGVISPGLDYQDFRKKYLDSGLLPSPKSSKPRVEEVCQIVAKDGGVLVLPHPGHEFGDSLAVLEAELGRFRRLLATFRDYGLEGVELYYYKGRDGEGINRIVSREAEALGLFVTYGSDCHGPGSGKDTLGKFWGDFPGFPPPSDPCVFARYSP